MYTDLPKSEPSQFFLIHVFHMLIIDFIFRITWTNCLGGKQAGKYKTLGHNLLHFKANHKNNIIFLTYRRPLNVQDIHVRSSDLLVSVWRVQELESFTYADFGIGAYNGTDMTLYLDHSSGKTQVEKKKPRILKYHLAYG